MRSKNNVKSSILSILIVLSMVSLVSAGFGSTYLPDIDGTPTLVLKAGETGSYFIYPQNLGEESLFIKIELIDDNNLVKNKLEESYEILPHTESDEFPIEFKIKIPSNTEQGEIFSIEYSVLSTQEKVDGGMVNFNPTGYYKKINVKVFDIESNFNWLLFGLISIVTLLIIGGVIYGIKKKH